MKVLVSGASGFVGKALCAALRQQGHQTVALVRHSAGPGEILWDPLEGDFAAGALEGFDAVVHLAGESIFGLWTAKKKKAIRDSRVKGTRYLVNALAGLSRPPKVLVCASAIGIYGDRGADLITESSHSGTGFLADVCREWEAACEPAAARGIRVVNTRFGVILDRSGGALRTMLPAFKMGVGGTIGDGRQYFSWVALSDVVGGLLFALTTDSLHGPVNFTAPAPVTNREFTKTLGHVLHRPTVLPVPAFAAQAVLGEMARELLLASIRVQPAALQKAGYAFAHPALEPCLRSLLDR